MYGKSHLLIGVSAGILVQQVTHLAGPALLPPHVPDSVLIVNRIGYYSACILGSLLPDIDHEFSMLGRPFGWVSRGIQHLFGHRNFFHSLVGIGGGLILGTGLLEGLLWGIGHGLLFALELSPSGIVALTHPLYLFLSTIPLPSLFVVGVGIFIGYVLHLLADAGTKGGIALLWPRSRRYGIPADRRKRFATGAWQEWAIDALVLLVITLCWVRGWVAL